jgi:carbonic anhydrase
MSAAVHNPRDTLSVQQFDFKEVHFKMPSEHTVSHRI